MLPFEELKYQCGLRTAAFGVVEKKKKIKITNYLPTSCYNYNIVGDPFKKKKKKHSWGVILQEQIILQYIYKLFFYFILESFNLWRSFLMIALLSSDQNTNQFLVYIGIEP